MQIKNRIIYNLNITTMSYLRFDKTLMTNLEESLPKEILRTNRREPTIVQPLLIAIREISWIACHSGTGD